MNETTDAPPLGTIGQLRPDEEDLARRVDEAMLPGLNGDNIDGVIRPPEAGVVSPDSTTLADESGGPAVTPIEVSDGSLIPAPEVVVEPTPQSEDLGVVAVESNVEDPDKGTQAPERTEQQTVSDPSNPVVMAEGINQAEASAATGDQEKSEGEAKGQMEDLPISLPPELSDRFVKLQAELYSNGARHVYGVDAEGKMHHISGDEVLLAFGYEPRNDDSETVKDPENPPSGEAEGRLSKIEENVSELAGRLDEVLDLLKKDKEPTDETPEPPTEETPTDTPEAARYKAEKEADKELDDAITQYAEVSNYSERGTSNKDERDTRLNEATERLKVAQEKVLDFQSETIMSADSQLAFLREDAIAATQDADTELEKLLAEKEVAGDNYDGSLDDRIAKWRLNKGNAELCLDLIGDRLEKRAAELQEFRVSQVLQLAKHIDDEKLRLRVEKHPRLAKINDWIQKHPKTRIGVGIGLAAIGVVGAATFNAPLVGLAVAGGSALRAYGSYNFVRGMGEVVANRKMKKADIESVQDLLDITNEQSTSRRHSKRIGAAVATVLALTPVVAKVLEASPSGPKLGGFNQATTPPAGTAAGVHPEVFIPPTNGNMLPWTYAEQVLHTDISNPAVLDKLTNNNLGIHFIGNGQGGGLGAINSVVINGQSYSDLGHINGAISAILGNTG